LRAVLRGDVRLFVHYQKNVRVRIVLAFGFAYDMSIDFRPDDIIYPPVQPV